MNADRKHQIIRVHGSSSAALTDFFTSCSPKLPCSLKPAERLFRECLAAAWATDFHLGTSPWDWELSLRGWPWGWELFCTGEGVQLTSPPGRQNPRRPASKLEKIVGGAGTSRTADQVCSSCFVG